jgi:hypothetical protein
MIILILSEASEKYRKRNKKRVGITTKVKVHAQDSLPKCEGGKINRILKK